MKLPTIKGLIKRRILINFLVDPRVISPLLPSVFRPKLVEGKAVIGICLIRLEQIRPNFLPRLFGTSSENVAHRIAVQWREDSGEYQDGVYIFRRDSNSWFNTRFGGKLFPGDYNYAKFVVDETSDYVDLQVDSNDHKVSIQLRANYSEVDETTTIFGSLDNMSAFFQAGAAGYSPVIGKRCFQGMCLTPYEWNMKLLNKEKLEVNYFTKVLGLNENQLVFDSIAIMRDIPHEWKRLKDMSG